MDSRAFRMQHEPRCPLSGARDPRQGDYSARDDRVVSPVVERSAGFVVVPTKNPLYRAPGFGGWEEAAAAVLEQQAEEEEEEEKVEGEERVVREVDRAEDGRRTVRAGRNRRRRDAAGPLVTLPASSASRVPVQGRLVVEPTRVVGRERAEAEAETSSRERTVRAVHGCPFLFSFSSSELAVGLAAIATLARSGPLRCQLSIPRVSLLQGNF